MFGKTLTALILSATLSVAGASGQTGHPAPADTRSIAGNLLQTGEDLRTRLNWQSYEPYYLFAVVAHYRESPFKPAGPGVAPR